MPYIAEDRRDDPSFDPTDYDQPSPSELAEKAMHRAAARGETAPLPGFGLVDPF